MSCPLKKSKKGAPKGGPIAPPRTNDCPLEMQQGGEKQGLYSLPLEIINRNISSILCYIDTLLILPPLFCSLLRIPPSLTNLQIYPLLWAATWPFLFKLLKNYTRHLPIIRYLSTSYSYSPTTLSTNPSKPIRRAALGAPYLSSSFSTNIYPPNTETDAEHISQAQVHPTTKNLPSKFKEAPRTTGALQPQRAIESQRVPQPTGAPHSQEGPRPKGLPVLPSVLYASRYSVAVFLVPLFVASSSRACQGGCREDKYVDTVEGDSTSQLINALPTALAAASIEWLSLKYNVGVTAFISQMFLRPVSWGIYHLLGPPSCPRYPYLGLLASISYGGPMYLYSSLGTEALSFPEASTLTHIFAAAVLSFSHAIINRQSLQNYHSTQTVPHIRVHRDVILFLACIYLPLLLLTILLLGAVCIQTKRISNLPTYGYRQLIVISFALTLLTYLLFGSTPNVADSQGGPLLWFLTFIFSSDMHASLLMVLCATSVVGLIAAFALAPEGGSHRRGTTMGSPKGGPEFPKNGFKSREQEAGDGPKCRGGSLSSVRKVFHFLLVGNLLLIAWAKALSFLVLVCGGLLWLLVAIEALRISHVSSSFSSWVESAYIRFTDVRDAHGLVVTHIYLVLGVVAPLLTTATLNTARGGGLTSRVPFTLLGAPTLLGLALVGCGDSMAAIVGSFCRSPVLPHTNNKTLAGFLAFLLSSWTFGLVLSSALPSVFTIDFQAFTIAVIAAGIFEAYTRDIDNFHLSMIGLVYYQLIAS